jgi:hypothetical protein
MLQDTRDNLCEMVGTLLLVESQVDGSIDSNFLFVLHGMVKCESNVSSPRQNVQEDEASLQIKRASRVWVQSRMACGF